MTTKIFFYPVARFNDTPRANGNNDTCVRKSLPPSLPPPSPSVCERPAHFSPPAQSRQLATGEAKVGLPPPPPNFYLHDVSWLGNGSKKLMQRHDSGSVILNASELRGWQIFELSVDTPSSAVASSRYLNGYEGVNPGTGGGLVLGPTVWIFFKVVIYECSQ
jgi:hypothetical protein